MGVAVAGTGVVVAATDVAGTGVSSLTWATVVDVAEAREVSGEDG
jgi:hypothetical protein